MCKKYRGQIHCILTKTIFLSRHLPRMQLSTDMKVLWVQIEGI